MAVVKDLRDEYDKTKIAIAAALVATVISIYGAVAFGVIPESVTTVNPETGVIEVRQSQIAGTTIALFAALAGAASAFLYETNKNKTTSGGSTSSSRSTTTTTTTSSGGGESPSSPGPSG